MGEERRGHRAHPSLIRYFSDVGILCCEASPVALEVTTQDDCVVWEGDCEAGQLLAHVGVFLCSVW